MPSNSIHLLPDSVANQIAAGEVIQRPASVIKELMENSIDAGATTVKVAVQDSGRTLIQVSDDGCGMNETDARLAFERHATSKISSAADLYSLSTMGFRGEALASIAAVAHVELLTRREQDELGLRLELAGSEVTAQEPCVAQKGSVFTVKNLFFNVPARRRFLKTDAAEMRHVVSEFLRVALAHPSVSVSLVSNGATLYNLPAGNAKQRVAGVAGRAMAQNLLPIESETSIVRIHGFVGTPETAKKSGGDQFFFANDRYMRSAYFHKAVLEAYRNIIAPDHSPAYYIYLEVDPQCIDVNVHPQKTEIKFDDDQAIWKILNATICSCLNDNNILPSIDFDSGERVEIPAYVSSGGPSVSSYDPFQREQELKADYANNLGRQRDGGYQQPPFERSAPHRNWESLYSVIRSQGLPSPEEGQAGAQGRLFDGGEAPTLGPECFSQLAGRYVVVASGDSLTIVDQHRAHERVQYERIKAMLAKGRVESQRQLIAEQMQFSSSDACIVAELQSELEQMGLDVSIEASEGRVSIESVPALMSVGEVRTFLEDLVEGCRSGEVDVKSDALDVMARRMAAHSAIPSGRKMSAEEMKSLYERLMQTSQPGFSPSGKRISRTISGEDIEAMF